MPFVHPPAHIRALKRAPRYNCELAKGRDSSDFPGVPWNTNPGAAQKASEALGASIAEISHFQKGARSSDMRARAVSGTTYHTVSCAPFANRMCIRVSHT